MNPGKFKMAQSREGDGGQFASLFTEQSIDNVANTPVVLNADANLYISINTPNGPARIHITTDGVPTSVGKYVDGEYSTIVPAGMYFSSDVAVNITPHGYDPSV